MAQNDPKRDGGQQQGGGGGGQQPKQQSRSRGKSIFDSTNLIGAALWLASALLTAIALMLIFIPGISCAGPRGQLVGPCLLNVITSTQGIYVLVGALVGQFIISGIVNRLQHNKILTRIGVVIESVINFIGFFWLICIELGMAPGVYAIVIPWLKLTVDTVGWMAFLWIASIGLNTLTTSFFNAPPSGSSSTPPRR